MDSDNTAITKPNIISLYYELTKPGIIYSNVLVATASYLFASHWIINIKEFLFFISGLAMIIAASCAANNILDKDIDLRMERTKSRATSSGVISVKSALLFCLILFAIGFSLISQTNILVVTLGAIASISYVFIYTPLKRISKYSTLVGTIPGSISLVAGYVCFNNAFDLTALSLFFAMVFWQLAHFYSIAIFRIKDYRAAKLPVWPITQGIDSTKKQIKIFSVLYLLSVLFLYSISDLNFIYLLLMLPASIYWLKNSFSISTSSKLWAKRMFLNSLVVILVFSLALSFGSISF